MTGTPDAAPGTSPDDGRPVAVVTGASAGIGLALAHRLAPHYRLVLSGRRNRLSVTEPMPDHSAYIAADFARPALAAGVIADYVRDLGIDRIARLVVNAGTGTYGAPEAEDATTTGRTLAVNLTAAIALAHALAEPLERAEGRLTLIGSVAHKGSQRAASYAASKAGLNGLARSLAEEWRGRIAVQVIHPGPVATGMHARAGYDPGRLARLFITPDEAAAEIARLIETGRTPATVSTVVKLRGLFSRGAGR